MIDFTNRSWHLYDDTVIIYKENFNDSIKFCHKCSKVIHDYLIEHKDKFIQVSEIQLFTSIDNKITRDIIKMLPSELIHPCRYVGIIFDGHTLTIKRCIIEKYIISEF